MKRFLYILKTYKFDLLAAISATILAYTAFMHFSDPGKRLIASIVVTVIFLLIIISLRFRDRSFVFSPLTWRGDKDPWIGYGKFELSRAERAFAITQADPGYIHNRCLNWADYRVTFNFKIVNKCLGVVVRAVDLANYVMLQIAQVGIHPHVRINGGWHRIEAKDANLEFQQPLSLDKWYQCKIVCENENIRITIEQDNTSIFDRTWTIIKGSLTFLFKEDSEDAKGVPIPFPISLEYGSVGFRNSGHEKAFIKNVLIEKL